MRQWFGPVNYLCVPGIQHTPAQIVELKQGRSARTFPTSRKYLLSASLRRRTMKKSALLLIFALILNGCVTCREHPMACTAGVIAVGAVAVAAASGGSSRMNGGY